MANEAEQALYEKLAAVPTFHPSTASLLPDDWTLEPGDVVTVQSDGQDYLTPVYSMSLDWNGASKVSIQSTGNKKRAPLSALQRRSFSSGRSGYKTQKDLDEAKVTYTRHFEDTDKRLESTRTVTGVLLDENGDPVVDPVTGEYVFDPDGATMSGKIVQTAESLTTLYTKTGVNSLGQSETLYSKISQNAENISLKIGRGEVATQLTVECGNVSVSGGNLLVDGYVTSAGLQSEIASLAYVEVNKLVATSLGDDEDTIETGYIDSVISESISTGTLSATTVTIGSADLADAVYSFGTPTASGGQISIPWTKVDGTAGTPINFNIADTAYYKSHVGIYQLALNGPIGQPYQEGENKGTLTADKYYQVVATPNAGTAQKFFFKTPTGGSAPLATQIDMQVRDASQSVPSAPSGEGSIMVFAERFSGLIEQYASQSGGPWYIPFDMTISGGTGTKRYYVRING